MAITITTTSSVDRQYRADIENAIYPPFVDNMPYESWTLAGKVQYFQLKAVGASSIIWSLVSGSLPDGLELLPDGKIVGTPTRVGTYTFTVQAMGDGSIATKELSVTAHDYRAKEYKKRKAGAWITMGTYQWPMVTKREQLPAFLARINKFNADEYADQLVAHGFKIINYSAFAGDAWRHWDSTFPTQKNFVVGRDILQELITACHARDILVTVYFAPDSLYNDPKYQNTDPNGKFFYIGGPEAGVSTYTTVESQVGKKIPGMSGRAADPETPNGWGDRNMGLITELSKYDHDGLWVDVGGRDPLLLPRVEPDFFRAPTAIAIMRTNHPWQLISINGGTAYLGNMWQYPDVDVVLYEGAGYTKGKPVNSALVVAQPYVLKKKMAVEALNILDWTFTFDSADDVPQVNHHSAEAIIDNIKKNWAVGATVLLNWPTLADGTLIPTEYAATLAKIGTFLKANAGYSEEPYIEVVEDILTLSTQSVARIYYTLDGSTPTIDSNIYAQPIKLKKNTQVKAISIQKGIPASTIVNKTIKVGEPDLILKSKKLLAVPLANDVIAKEANNYFRGMLFRVGNEDVTVSQIGRKYAGSIGDRQLIIRKYWNNEAILFDTFYGDGLVDEDGYQYSTITPLVFRAGMSYYIAIQENPNDDYYSNTLTQVPVNRDIRVMGARILNKNADLAPVTNNGVGQFINFKYTTSPNKKGDLALGRATNFQHHVTTATLNPNAQIFYPINATDGEPNSSGQASGDWMFVTAVDLGSIHTISKVIVDFHVTGFATALDLHIAKAKNQFIAIESKVNNNALRMVFNFQAQEAKYIYLRVMKPDGPDQRGGGATIANIEIY